MILVSIYSNSDLGTDAANCFLPVCVSSNRKLFPTRHSNVKFDCIQIMLRRYFQATQTTDHKFQKGQEIELCL